MATIPVKSLSTPCVDAAEPIGGNYFVAAYPPFSAWSKTAAVDVQNRLWTIPPPNPAARFGLYVHIPFCAQRCQYCYYLSYQGKTLGQMGEYVEGLIHELSLYGQTAAFRGRQIGFVYFGGGTPSLLSLADMRRLLTGLQVVFPWTEAEEITFECAPCSVTPAKLHLLRRMGVNRLSLGIQQLNDDVLQRNGRVHLVADVDRAWKHIREFRFAEVNVDLIAGLVGETDQTFLASLDRVVEMDPDSVTIYPLEIPRNTPLARDLQQDAVRAALPTWEAKRERLGLAFARLAAAGFSRRSAYAAAKGSKSRGKHVRFVYQEEQYRGADLLGIGVSSLSYCAGGHFQNRTTLDSYMQAVHAGTLAIERAYWLSPEEQSVREFVLQLKLGRVASSFFRNKFGVEVADRFAEPLARFQDQGWLIFDRDGVTMTSEGLLRVDRLIPEFYLPVHRALPYW